ncbi:hypothetical protein RvY_14479-2 [Ramazzottius varieornatus]|uniref:Uncharacterized protein n=1 Tax=Ramazzottius varieornatus TaxID=947166 RepID=A0A1D1VVA5_RAMVA|nr:hypothetical protein RvY_14479-2 [Ramazzottius varieornatus]
MKRLPTSCRATLKEKGNTKEQRVIFSVEPPELQGHDPTTAKNRLRHSTHLEEMDFGRGVQPFPDATTNTYFGCKCTRHENKDARNKDRVSAKGGIGKDDTIGKKAVKKRGIRVNITDGHQHIYWTTAHSCRI